MIFCPPSPPPHAPQGTTRLTFKIAFLPDTLPVSSPPHPPPHPNPSTRVTQGTTRLTFKIATRGLLGLKNAMLTATRGMGILNTLFDSYRPVAGVISMRENGSLVAFETGQV